jgi:hypothetical protein
MKKMILGLMVALGCVCNGFTAETQYKVYDVKMSLTSTKALGETATPCGESYIYRAKKNIKVYGVIAGCGCLAAAGDPTCVNFLYVFWDATSKVQLTNVTYKTEIVQRIGKDENTVEHLVTFTVEDQQGFQYHLQLAGFGKYHESKNSSEFDYLSISNGKVTGWKDAPYLTVRGSCGPCAEIPDETTQSAALTICDCACSLSETWDKTVVNGTYTMKYNSSKSKKAEKNGLTNKTLGLPSYVNLTFED